MNPKTGQRLKADLDTLGQTIDRSVFLTRSPEPNRPPTITSFTANRMSVQVGGQATISVQASDPDGDTLTYEWSAMCGILSGTTGAADKTWTAPGTPDACTVSVIVTDPAGASATQSVDIEVTPTPSTTFATGDRIQVNTGDGSNLNVRTTPGGSVIGQQPDGTLGTVIGGPVFADGRWWWRVDFDTSVDGWVAEDFIGTLPPPPIPVAYVSFSVFNATAPDTITGHVEGPVFSVDNLP